MDEDGPHYDAEQVTGARQENVVRWVLLVSLLLGNPRHVGGLDHPGADALSLG